ncbi:MAG: hypothetical protein KDD61_17660 [Bdellovibrionales bacterium]|nr:hypothetical protein [Bdellovibrionales bacterium]
MLILGLDFETTGLSPQTDRVIEIGAVVWDTDSQKPKALFSELVLPAPFSGLSPEIVKVTGIDDETLKTFGVDGNQAFERLQSLVKECDYIVAHNAAFDRGFYQQELLNYGMRDEYERPWIDTVLDVPYPEEIGTRKLTYLAAEHGFVNVYAHRAVFDTLTMLSILGQYPLDQVIARSQSPNVMVTSHVSFDEKDKAKNMGFRWDAPNKKWVKSMKLCDVEVTDFPFKYSVSEPELSL